MFKETSKECEGCRITKEIDEFRIHRNSYRNYCKKCITGREYYKNSRMKKMLEDIEKYRKHNNAKHYEWVKNNQEYCKKYEEVYKNSEEGIVSAYKSSAKSKKLIRMEMCDFEALIKTLIRMECFYCGKTTTEGSLKERIIGDYNGIDRIDSNVGYTIDNCVACCKNCNYIKNTMDIGSFIRKCIEISIFNGKDEYESDIRLDFHSGINLVGNSGDYKKYKSRAENKDNMVFDITKEKFNEIVKSDCYLCGNTNPKQRIGIDRFDNSIGYTIDNCKPCCNYCNIMKKDLDHEAFINCVYKISEFSQTEEHLDLGLDAEFTKIVNYSKCLTNDNTSN